MLCVSRDCGEGECMIMVENRYALARSAWLFASDVLNSGGSEETYWEAGYLLLMELDEGDLQPDFDDCHAMYERGDVEWEACLRHVCTKLKELVYELEDELKEAWR